MKNTVVKLKHENDIVLVPDIDVFTGKPLVTLFSSIKTEMAFRPIEAERLARALVKAAAAARKKVRR